MSSPNNNNNLWQHSESNSGLSDELLLAYLEGKLDEENKRKVEAMLSNEGMESDAIDGLLQMPTQQTKRSVDKLNRQLAMAMSKKRRKKATLSQLHIITYIILILVLVIVAFFVYKHIAQSH